jgi:hypothetical protein
MNELQMSVVLGIVIEPEANKVNVADRKLRDEVSRMLRIFQLAREQRIQSQVKVASSLCRLEPVLSLN